MNMSIQERRELPAVELGSGRMKELKAAAHPLEPVAWVGKSGMTESVVAEIKKQLKKKGLIKVKLLKAALEDTGKKELAGSLAEKTGSVLIAQVGFVVVLYRERPKSI